jgi:hypothetical protein
MAPLPLLAKSDWKIWPFALKIPGRGGTDAQPRFPGPTRVPHGVRAMTARRLSRRALGRLAAGLLQGVVLSGLPRPAAAGAAKGPLTQMKARLYPFATSPFPFDGVQPDDDERFLDVKTADGRLGHTAPRGGVYYQDETYSDRRALLALPAGFDLGKPAAIVVFFHGNASTLQRDVVARQHVLDQVQASTLNAALIAPQFAVDALDSSAGRFWQEGAFAAFMAEAAEKLADLLGQPSSHKAFARLPIFLVAFSGGYNPAIYAATVGGARHRIHGLVLLDALSGEASRFVDWIRTSRTFAFFFSAYSEATEDLNAVVESRLQAHRVPFATDLPDELLPGSVAFHATPGVVHVDYMTKAWVANPLTWVLNRVPGMPR